jgi:hypothetical protein
MVKRSILFEALIFYFQFKTGLNAEFYDRGSIQSYRLSEMRNCKTHLTEFFKFFNIRRKVSKKILFSVHEGSKLNRIGYKYAENFDENQYLWICGPLNTMSNIGRFISNKDWNDFVGLSGSFYRSCRMYPEWNAC